MEVKWNEDGILGALNNTENNPAQATIPENTPSQLALWRIRVGRALLHPISIKHRCQIDAQIDDQIDCLLDGFLDQFLIDFRTNLASKIDAKSIEELPEKVRP